MIMVMIFVLVMQIPTSVYAINTKEYKSIEYVEKEEITGDLNVYFSQDSRIIQPYIEDFTKKYPKVNVNYKCITEYEEFIRNGMETGDYGDVLYMPSFVGNNDLDKYFEPLGELEELKEKYDYVENTNRLGNTVYAIPSSAYLTGLIYNKDVFSKAGITEIPKTFDDFITDLKQIRERTTAVPFCSNYASDWAMFYWTGFPFLEMTGDKSYKGGDFVHELNPFTKGGTHYEAYKLLYDIVNSRLCEADINSMTWDKAVTKLSNGNIGCMVMGTWAIDVFKENAADPDSIGFMPFPNNIDGRQYVTLFTDYAYAISKNSKNKEAARAFVRYMLNESGYAVEHDRVSIVKTDPLPKAYGEMNDVIVQYNDVFVNNNYSYYEKLNKNIRLDDASELKRIIASAAGVTNESYDEIMADWNERWESARPRWMETHVRGEDEKGAINSTKEDTKQQSLFVDNHFVSLSQTEREYIAEKKKLKIGYVKNMAPVQYMSETHNFMGIAAYLCKLIGENTGFELIYETYENTDAAIEAMEAGEIDMIAGLEQNNQYISRVKYSRQYMEFINVLVKNDTENSDNLEGKVQAVVEGERTNKEIIDTSNFLTSSTIADALKSIDIMEASFGIFSYYSAEYYIRYEELSHLVVIPTANKYSMAFAFPRSVDTRLISICNKCIYSVPEESLQMLITQQMDPPSKPITIMRFVQSNPLTALVIVIAFVIVVVGFAGFISFEKNRNAQKHKLDAKRYETLSKLMDEYVFEFDFLTGIMLFDQKFESKFGFSGEVDVYDNKNLNYTLSSISGKCLALNEKDAEEIDEFELTDVEGQTQWYRMKTYIIDDSLIRSKRLIGKLINVQKDVEDRLRMQEKAEKDNLTGLYNREGFEKRFERLIENWNQIRNLSFAILDIDEFKRINDSLGHAGGDEALKQMVDKLSILPKGNCLCSRYGGDEFIVCLYDIDRTRMEVLFEQLVKSMDYEMEYQSMSCSISVSVGVVYTEKPVNMATLFRYADEALYRTKTLGKNNYEFVEYEDK